MKAIIIIEMDNAAFHPVPDTAGPADDGNGAELARILRQLADTVEVGILEAFDSIPLMDSNGNTVGSMDITDAQEDIGIHDSAGPLVGQ